MNVGERIREKRLRLGISQAELAEKMNEGSSAVISNWEKGKNLPNVEKLAHLCIVLKCRPDELVFPESEVFPEKDARELLFYFDSMSEKNKRMLLKIAKVMREDTENIMV